MKTITSFLLGTLLLILSIIVLATAIRSAIYATTTFQPVGETTIISFEFTFAIMAIIQAIVAVVIIAKSIDCYKITTKYYNKYQESKRDHAILDQLDNEMYAELYKKLRECKTLREKLDLTRDFFINKIQGGTAKHTPQDFDKFVKDLLNKHN